MNEQSAEVAAGRGEGAGQRAAAEQAAGGEGAVPLVAGPPRLPQRRPHNRLLPRPLAS
jgi:hypothetical protein